MRAFPIQLSNPIKIGVGQRPADHLHDVKPFFYSLKGVQGGNLMFAADCPKKRDGYGTLGRLTCSFCTAVWFSSLLGNCAAIFHWNFDSESW